ncbi:MAG: glutamyl-tRNA reductase [Candidatus Latescibacteria bacterium]|nr:glutamyl-tRNA reductase [Candidatus Latescibacterota bacterium]NIO27183.1 glutamyl-tRNA reductase [Candidatus Latescibacterota bacterium]NIO54707.1 glutamyl-tRNA reductase [Candidatus Latescibacterota bacterium]NIT00790.1 glutamyl-tRNA reductase [Candidatus Latescibacterota bacterium]NIT37713.1 glutamyl-tRNA reductase [Candidatus Latescibacterota bacterium]
MSELNLDHSVPIALIGISHKTAPIEIREKVALDAKEQESVLRSLSKAFEIDGCLVVSTCNRTEVYISAEEYETVIPEIQRWLDGYKKSGYFTNEQYAYVLTGLDAVRHLFSVISSLDAQVVGEPQITGQVKDAYNLAKELKTTDSLLNKIISFGLQAQKKIRRNTFLADGAVSISFAGVELARKIFNTFDDRHLLLIGAGETAELAAQHFLEKGAGSIAVVNRTLEKARELAGRFNGKAYGFDELSSAFNGVDIVISATSSSDHVLSAEFMSEISKARRYAPMFLIDLAIPRDIDPDVDKIDGIYLYNLDDLQAIVQINLDKRKQEMPKSFKILDRYVVEFEKWIATHSTSSTINRLRRYFDHIRRSEMNRLRKRLPKDNMDEIDYLTQSIMNKLMHQHIKTLKKTATDPERHQQNVELMRDLYELDQE